MALGKGIDTEIIRFYWKTTKRQLAQVAKSFILFIIVMMTLYKKKKSDEYVSWYTVLSSSLHNA